MYSGAERLLTGQAPLLHYAFDAVLLGLIVITLMGPRQPQVQAFKDLWPYWAFALIYFAWGLIVAPNRGAVLPAAIRGIELNTLLVLAVGVAVSHRHDVTRLASLLQIVALVNFGIAFLEWGWPQLIPTIGQLWGPSAVVSSFDRPAGLWINPNEAAIALLFIFLIGHWARPWLAWAGRIGAAFGIFLTASRGGMYPLIVSIAAYAAKAGPRLFQVSLRRRLMVVGVIVALICLALGVGAVLGHRSTRSMTYPITRLFNPLELTPEPGDVPRSTAAAYWFDRALHGPWYGSGVFSFQGNNTDLPGAHNVYLVIWGEAGIPMALVYLLLITLGIRRIFRSGIAARDRFALALMWFVYLLEGFLWQNQFTSVFGIMIMALLYRLPGALLKDAVLLEGEGAHNFRTGRQMLSFEG
jgi:hypothetical protein